MTWGCYRDVKSWVFCICMMVKNPCKSREKNPRHIPLNTPLDPPKQPAIDDPILFP